MFPSRLRHAFGAPLLTTAVTALGLFWITAPRPAFAWGLIGHRMVAETAAILTGEAHPSPGMKPWRDLLNRQRFELGYYATLPDSHFKTLDGAGGDVESPLHFFDRDLFPPGIPIPRRYEDHKAKHLPLIGEEAFQRAGTSPWRIEQLSTLILKELKSVKKPTGGYQSGLKAKGDTARVYQALTWMGVLAHYTGDATMPYHATDDWNGWKTGQGGIHFYVEADCVNVLEPGLSEDVLRLARKNRSKWIQEWSQGETSPAGAMLRVYDDSLSKIPETARLDRKHAVLTPSPEDPSKRGAANFARRKPPEQGCPPMRELLVERLAKASVLTAWIWELALPTDIDWSEAPWLQFSDLDALPAYPAPAIVSPSEAPPLKGSASPQPKSR